MLVQRAGAVEDAHELERAGGIAHGFPTGVARFDAVNVVLRDLDVETLNRAGVVWRRSKEGQAVEGVDFVAGIGGVAGFG